MTHSTSSQTVLETCPVCGEPTLVRMSMPFLGKDMDIKSDCRCERERKEREEAEEKRRERAERAEHERSACFPFDSLCHMDFSHDDGANAPISRLCRNYVGKIGEAIKQNAGILFYGAVGSGKTFYAACLANAAIDAGYSVAFTSLATVSAQMNADYGKHRDSVVSGLCRKDIVVIDDLGIERGTDTARENIYQAVNALCLSGTLIIATTNMSIKAMQDETDPTLQRIYSRIFGSCQPVEVKASDRRREITEEKAAFYKSLL